MNEINSLSDIQSILRTGEENWKRFGNVKASYHPEFPLVIFNYTPAAQFERRWNWFEINSRGLIFNVETFKLIALPFPKFFNWMEEGRCSHSALIETTEKLDGSLGIGYFFEGNWYVSTRGSFVSEQALWATEKLKEYKMENWPVGLTPLFEIIYPENRVVVDYEDQEELVLIGARWINTETDLTWFPFLTQRADQCGFRTPRFHNFNSWKDVLDLQGNLEQNREGFVLRFADGQRFKIKGDRYVEVHRLLHQTSYKRVVQAVRDGTLVDAIKDIPDEFLVQIREWRGEIEEKVASKEAEVKEAFGKAPRGDRKTFALWVKENHWELSSYLFAMLDGKEIREMIFDKEF